MNTGSFSETSLPHLLSDVDCQGSEANLLQCQYSTTTSCGPTEDAAAVCQGEQMHVRLQSYIYICPNLYFSHFVSHRFMNSKATSKMCYL